MANMLDYILWRGDLSFRERPFNEVDNLVFCEFGYAPWDGLLPVDGSGEVLFLREAPSGMSLRAVRPLRAQTPGRRSAWARFPCAFPGRESAILSTGWTVRTASSSAR